MNSHTNSHAEALDTRIAKLLEELDGTNGNTEEYNKITVNLVKLMTLKNEAIKLEDEHSIETEKVNNETEKLVIERAKTRIEEDKLDHEKNKFIHEQEKTRSWKPSPDAVVTAAASVVGILFVLHYEKFGIVTSKALNFVGKMK